LKAAIYAVDSAAAKNVVVVAAVKPRGKHSSISHFLTRENRRIEFDQDRDAFRLLKRLRDEAHDLANRAHRLSRDMMHFYELGAVLPSLNERERQHLFREFGSIKKIVRLTSEQMESQIGKRKAPRAVSDIAKFRAGRSRQLQPLIVPIRFVETDGAAEDLIPIETR
jgi:excinuclease UvrABC nuclease subunit